MKCELRVGQKVTMRDNSFVWRALTLGDNPVPVPPELVMPKFGCIYTIREMFVCNGTVMLRFVEIVNPLSGSRWFVREEIGFPYFYFRPAVDPRAARAVAELRVLAERTAEEYRKMKVEERRR